MRAREHTVCARARRPTWKHSAHADICASLWISPACWRQAGSQISMHHLRNLMRRGFGWNTRRSEVEFATRTRLRPRTYMHSREQGVKRWLVKSLCGDRRAVAAGILRRHYYDSDIIFLQVDRARVGNKFMKLYPRFLRPPLLLVRPCSLPFRVYLIWPAPLGPLPPDVIHPSFRCPPCLRLISPTPFFPSVPTLPPPLLALSPNSTPNVSPHACIHAYIQRQSHFPLNHAAYLYLRRRLPLFLSSSPPRWPTTSGPSPPAPSTGSIELQRALHICVLDSPCMHTSLTG